MADQEENRSEQATPFKLRQAQKRGQAAKSQEVVFASILAAFTAMIFAVGHSMARDQLMIIQSLFSQAGRLDWSVGATLEWLAGTFVGSLQVLAPLLFGLACVAILANMAQVGAIFSFNPIVPDFERINPAAGFKRLFSIRLVYEAFKSLFKLIILSWVLWLALEHLLPDLVNLVHVDPHGHAQAVLGNLGPLLFKLLLIILIIALLDMAYTRWDFGKKMRMSRREVTDEHKQREGDPRIRSRMRQLRMELLKQSRAVRRLPEADVLLTNPTHLAVAISYKHGDMPAPKLLAKGAGELAAKMRQTARRHRIPVVENPPLARALYKRLDFDEYVPEDLYPKLAKILLWVYAMRETGERLGKTQ